jgi:hypothetical protein
VLAQCWRAPLRALRRRACSVGEAVRRLGKDFLVLGAGLVVVALLLAFLCPVVVTREPGPEPEVEPGPEPVPERMPTSREVVEALAEVLLKDAARDLLPPGAVVRVDEQVPT